MRRAAHEACDEYFINLLFFHGLLLCRSKNRIVVEHALQDLKKPIGVAEWKTKIVTSLSKELKGSLPSNEALERELGCWE